MVTAGTATLRVGQFTVPNALTWNEGGYTYSLEAPAGAVSLDQLKRVAASIR